MQDSKICPVINFLFCILGDIAFKEMINQNMFHDMNPPQVKLPTLMQDSVI